MENVFAIQAKKLWKLYGSFEAVKGINFSIQKEECFGFLGPNGAGKTSTMQMIYRAAPISGGSLTIQGLEAASGKKDRAIKSRMGVIPQINNLDMELTVWETLIIFCRFYRLYGKAAGRRADELLEFVDLSHRKNSKIKELSGGMMRRVLIARSLIGDPDIIILDEPTAGLDPRARQNLWEHLRALKERGKTLVLTTHYMEEANSLCDRLVIMDQGMVVGEGTPDELIKHYVTKNAVTTEEEATALEQVFLKLTKEDDSSTKS